MDARVVLLRGVNLGPRRRIAMPELRELLAGAGFDNVRTYLASGNVVLASDATEQELAQLCARLVLERFGFDVEVLVRTRAELAEIVRRNPLGDVATNPKRYQVSFLAQAPDQERLAAITALATDNEQLVLDGRELYAWHPDGVARSRLWAALAGPRLGVPATARNWSTVTNLLSMASEA